MHQLFMKKMFHIRLIQLSSGLVGALYNGENTPIEPTSETLGVVSTESIL